LDIEALDITDVKLLKVRKFGDSRGFFCEAFARRLFPDIEFVQDNLSMSSEVGTVRGLHFQSPPFAQTKLVTVVRGAVFDVAVDIRRGSPTFGRWAGAELDSDGLNQLLIPKGFAHGFCTLRPDTLLFYKVDAYYAPAHDHGIRWDDPALGIPWPVDPAQAILSDKDRRQPLLRDYVTPFVYEP
jgi:dTDP-4-dehydrorhamnose 3,5-epimerase